MVLHYNNVHALHEQRRKPKKPQKSGQLLLLLIFLSDLQSKDQDATSANSWDEQSRGVEDDNQEINYFKSP